MYFLTEQQKQSFQRNGHILLRGVATPEEIARFRPAICEAAYQYSTETRKLAEWILAHLGPDVPLHFTAFHPDFKLQDKPRTPAATLDRARQIALEVGMRYVYEGNNYGDGANTYCPQCRELLVRRSWHDVMENQIENGACPKCGFAIAGVWANDEKKKRGFTPSTSAPTRSYGHLNL